MNHAQASTAVSAGAVWPRERDLSFWYRPWRYAHGTRMRSTDMDRLGLSDPDDELLQRLRYPAWCQLFSLPPHPAEYDGSIWWEIASTDASVFERANYLAGLVLLLASNRRDTFQLTRTAGKEAAASGDLRWVMQQASFVPPAVLALGEWEGIADAAMCGYLSLRLATAHAAPALAGRIMLRYPEDLVVRAPAAGAAQEDPRCERYLARLWTSATTRAGGTIEGTN